MKNYKRLGKLKDQPLVYSMGAVVIDLPNIGIYINELQDKLRDEYPQYSKMQVSIASPSPLDPNKMDQEDIEHFIIKDAESKTGVIFTNKRIVFHTLDYLNFEDFGTKFKFVLEKFRDCTKLKYHSGLAFRQVDNIRPTERYKESIIEDCIKSQYLGSNLFEEEKVYKFNRQECRYKLSSGRFVVARIYNFEKERSSPVPQDLLPYYMALNHKGMNEPVLPPFVLADFEANNTYGGKSTIFDVNNTIQELDELHQYASVVFQDMVTESFISKRQKG